MDTAIVWLRDDLRVSDNPVLADAAAAADELVPLYVVDPRRRGENRLLAVRRRSAAGSS